MKKSVLIPSLLLCSACATPGSLRERGPALTVDTSKQTLEFAECLMDKYQKAQIRPTFTPRQNGGTIEFNFQTAVANNSVALIEITDMSDRRQIRLFSQGDGPVRNLNPNITSCI